MPMWANGTVIVGRRAVVPFAITLSIQLLHSLG